MAYIKIQNKVEIQAKGRATVCVYMRIHVLREGGT